MKAEWIVYGPDMSSDAGWRVLGRSEGVTRKDQRFFLSLCDAVPHTERRETGSRVYFGYVRGPNRFLGRAEYVGKDYFGREGAWVFYGFILASRVSPMPSC